MERTSGLTIEVAIEDPLLEAEIVERLGEVPDLRLTDHGEEAAVRITDAIPEFRTNQIVILLADDPDGLAAFRAGVSSLLPKTAGIIELRLALAAVARGLAVAPMGAFGAEALSVEGSPPEPRSLSARELGVLALLSEGASNKEIARRLGISLHTAKFHVASLLAKLDVASRTEAVAQAVRLGLLML